MLRFIISLIVLPFVSVFALNSAQEQFFGLDLLRASDTNLTGKGYSFAISDTDFDLTHPALGWVGATNAYAQFHDNPRLYVTNLPVLNPRVYAAAHASNSSKTSYGTRHGISVGPRFQGSLNALDLAVALPVSANNVVTPGCTMSDCVGSYHGTQVAGSGISGLPGPLSQSMGPAPRVQWIAYGGSAMFMPLISMIPDGNPVRTVYMNRSFTGSSYVHPGMRINAGVIVGNAAGNSFNYVNRTVVNGNAPHLASIRWLESLGYDLVVGGVHLSSPTSAYMAQGGSQRNHDVLLTTYVHHSIDGNNTYDKSVGGTSNASPLMGGGLTLVQQAFELANPGRWLRPSQLIRIMRRSAAMIDDPHTGLRLPVVNFHQAAILARTYRGDPSLEPNFNINETLRPRVNSDEPPTTFVDPRYFRVSTSYGPAFTNDYTTMTAETNGVISVQGNRGTGTVTVALRNGWGDLAVCDFSEPGKRLLLGFSYDTSLPAGPGKTNSMLVGIKEMHGSSQFMDDNLLGDNTPAGRLAFRFTQVSGQSTVVVELVRCSVLPVLPSNGAAEVWKRPEGTTAPGWDSNILARAAFTNLHNGMFPRLDIEINRTRANLRINGSLVLDAAHGLPEQPLTRATPYFHVSNGDSLSLQRIAGFSSRTVHGTLPVVSATTYRDRALEGIPSPIASGVITVTRRGSTNSPLNVALTISGTATPGTDYTAIPNPVVIPAGISSIDIPVAPITDRVVEPREFVSYALVSSAAYTMAGGSSTGVVYLEDMSDADGDGLLNEDEDTNRNGVLHDDDANANMLPNYLDYNRSGSSNVPPVVVLVSNIVASLPTGTLYLDASMSYDKDGHIVTSQWGLVSNSYTLGSFTGMPHFVFGYSNQRAATNFVVRYICRDNDGATSTGHVTITLGFRSHTQVAVRANSGALVPMTLVSNNLWLVTADYRGGIDAIRFEATGPGAVYGDSNLDQNAEINGTPIPVVGVDGKYRIQFNDLTRAYSIQNISTNRPPFAHAGTNQITLLSGGPITLSGHQSYDLDGVITQYAWRQVSGPLVSVPSLNTNRITIAIPAASNPTSYVFSLVCHDNLGASATSRASVIQRTYLHTSRYAQVYLVSTADNQSNAPMSLVSNYAWQITATFSEGTNQQFRFREGVNTSLMGDSNLDGNLEFNGTPIRITSGSGTYRIKCFDYYHTYTVEQIATNQRPVAHAGTNQTVVLSGGVVTLNGRLSSDPDGTITNYRWFQVSGPVVTVPSANTNRVSLQIPAQALATSYVFGLVCHDNLGLANTGTVAVSQLNPPLLKTYTQVYFLAVSAGVTSTPMSLVSNYTWEATSVFREGTNESFRFDVSGAGAFFGDTARDGVAESGGAAIPVAQGSGAYRVRFNDATKRYWVVRTVTNRAPMVHAGTNQTVQLTGGSVTLSGQLSSDPDGTITNYRWFQVSGPAVTVSSANTNRVSLQIPAQMSATSYVFGLICHDHLGLSSTGTVSVAQVNPAWLRTYSNVYFRGTPNGWGTQVMTLVSNYVWEAQVTVGTAADQRFKFDVYGDWTVNFGDNNADGLAEQGGGNIAFLQGAGLYTVRFNDQTKRYWVNKVIVNQPPVVNAGANQTVALAGGTLNLDGRASYDAEGVIADYAWSQVSGPSALINNPASALASVVIPAQTAAATYVFQLLCRDNEGLVATGRVTITQQAASLLKTYPQVYFRGTPNGWGTQAMTLVSNYVWETQVTVGTAADQRFKFDVYGDWTLNFGDNNADGLAEQGGGNIAFLQGAGLYTVRFNDQTKRYWVNKVIVNQPPLVNAGANQTVELAGGTLNLDGRASYDAEGEIADYAWSQVSGPSALINNPASALASVVIPAQTAAATYVFQLLCRDNEGLVATGRVTITQQAASLLKTYPQVYFRGTPNGWGTQAMTLVSNYVWEAQVTVGTAADQRFKIDVYGDWTLSFGDNNADGLAEQGGGNIAFLQGAGLYIVRFNDQTKRYLAFRPAAGFLTRYTAMTVAGSFNSWNPAANNMKLVDHYTWQYDVLLFGPVTFKFVANSAWASGNWGDANPSGSTIPMTGVADAGAANISLNNVASGLYRVLFREDTLGFDIRMAPSVAAASVTASPFATAWESAYSIDLHRAAERLGDPDSDELVNLEEYYQGTHPMRADTDGDHVSDRDELISGTDPRASVEVLTVGLTWMGGRAFLVWPYAEGRTYTIEYTTGSGSGAWEAYSQHDALMIGPGMMQVDVTETLDLAPAVFRVRVSHSPYP